MAKFSALVLPVFVDFMLLLAADRCCGGAVPVWRCAAGAAIAGVYAAARVFPGGLFLRGTGWRLALLTAVGLVSFGLRRAAIRKTSLYALLSMALGGISAAVGRGDVLGMLLCGALVSLLAVLSLPRDSQFSEVGLTLGQRRVEVMALADTGNRLSDPVTGLPVLVAASSVGSRLTGLSEDSFRDPVGTLSSGALPGKLRLIPYHAVGGSGLLLGLRPDEVRIDGKVVKTLVAFDPGGLNRENGYQALLGGSLCGS